MKKMKQASEREKLKIAKSTTRMNGPDGITKMNPQRKMNPRKSHPLLLSQKEKELSMKPRRTLKRKKSVVNQTLWKHSSWSLKMEDRQLR